MKHGVNDFISYEMLPVVVPVDGEMVLFAPLTDSEAAILLVREPGGPFDEICLVKLLFGVHGIPPVIDRANRAIRTIRTTEIVIQVIIPKTWHYCKVPTIEGLRYSCVQRGQGRTDHAD